MSTSRKYELPWPPSVNHYWILIKAKGGGRKVLGKKGREFREAVMQLVRDKNLLPLTEQLEVRIWVYPPDRRKRDLDNIVKPVFDALEHGEAFKDDYQIADYRVTREDITKGGRVIVEIKEL